MSNQITTNKKGRRANRNFPRRFIGPRQIKNTEDQAAPEQAGTEQKNRSAWDKFNVGITTAATVFIAIAAIVTGVVGYYQWSALKSTDEATHTLADAALKQAEAVSRQANVMQGQLDSFEKEARVRLRAYVYVVVGAHVPEAGKPLTIDVQFIASGQTPAYQVHAWAASRFLDYPTPIKDDWDSVTPTTPGSTAPVVTQGIPLSFQLVAPYALTQDNVDTLTIKKTRRPHVYGRVDYKDAFKCRRYLVFCYSFDFPSPTQPTPQLCDQHNETDGEPGACVTE
jgi:hypothetical protein